jgi:1-phosphofructokinase
VRRPGPLEDVRVPDIRIVTVTLNPAVDRVLEAPNFTIGSHVRARRIGWYPAGKGINVARVLAMLGSRCIATGLVGRNELGMFEEYLERVGQGRIITQLLLVRGRTRDNVTIQDPVLDTETHIRDEGFTVQPEDVRRITGKVGMLARTGTTMVFSGSLPRGLSLGDLRTMLHRCNDQGARAVVDTSDRVLEALRGEPLWMAKLNAEELAVLSGMPTATHDDAVAAARALCVTHGGVIENVVATRGAAGAILIAPGVEIVSRVFVHPGRIANTVGCGDSLLAGMLHHWSRTEDWAGALRKGVATATATATSRVPGTFSMEDVEEFWDAASVEALEHISS